MTASTEAASNGATDTPQPERSSGMARVGESVAFHTAVIAHNASIEAERLCDDLYRTASDAYFQERGTITDAAQALTDPEAQAKIKEALDCLGFAQQYLRHLMACDEPPF